MIAIVVDYRQGYHRGPDLPDPDTGVIREQDLKVLAYRAITSLNDTEIVTLDGQQLDDEADFSLLAALIEPSIDYARLEDMEEGL